MADANVKYVGTADVFQLPNGELVAKGQWSEEEVSEADIATLEAIAPGDFEYEGYDPNAVDATDAAKEKAEELGVDLSAVKGSGKGGRITVTDVEASQPAEVVEGPPIGGDLSNEARTAGEQPHALVVDEEDPYLEPDAAPLAGARDVDEDDPAREDIKK